MGHTKIIGCMQFSMALRASLHFITTSLVTTDLLQVTIVSNCVVEAILQHRKSDKIQRQLAKRMIWGHVNSHIMLKMAAINLCKEFCVYHL